MAITHIQDKGQYSGASASVVVHLTTNTTATDTLIAAFCLPTGQSVKSVNDSTNNRWMQGGVSTSAGGNVECWVARGIQGGNASVTAVFSAASVGTNISEWSGITFQSPMDQWSQNTATNASVTPQTLSPRTTGDLIVAIGQTAASIGGTPSGYTALSVPGDTGFAAAYQILSGSVVAATHWNTSAASTWACVEAAFLPANSSTIGATTGNVGMNPLLQFPEVMVQISEAQDFQAPFQGIGIWTDITSYVKSMTLGPIGRQHELDRVQAAQASIVCNGRDGTFMPWNTSSFLYPGGLDPMSPLKVTAAWNGITYPVSYTYIQSITPTIQDVLNVDVTLDGYDIFQLLSLRYLSNNNYAQEVLNGT